MGRIFDIQRYSVHDGEGIRTIVFFQGCSLRCRWCCNPESQEGEGQEVSVAQVMQAVERDRPYFRRSGGGLTLSGGEALLQADFAREILKEARESGIHTAIESTALSDEVEKILPYLDVFLLDIKHINPAKHEEYTGRRNDAAIKNAPKISKATELIVRVPVVPGFNATIAEITEIARFAASAGASEIHLLPYHRLGEGKYKSLGRAYPMGDTQPPSDSQMEELKKAADNHLHCQIGG